MGDRSSLPDSHSNKPSIRDKEKRRHQRREPRQLVYIDLGPDNCGFILDVSEGGISFKGISSLHDGETLKVRFRLPGTDLSIQAEGQFVRAGNTANSSVLRFRDVPLDVRMQIREWVVLAEQEESASGEGAAPSVESSAPSFQPAKKNKIENARPIGHDGISPVSSMFAQAIPPSGESAIFAPNSPRPEPPIRAASSNTPKAPAAPNVPEEKLPFGGNPSASPAGHESWSDQGEIKNAAWPREPFELKIRPTPKAIPAPKVDNQAVPAGTAKQPRNAKSFHVSQFTAGIVVGCVVLASAGGGLVATGRLRLAKPSSPSGIAATANPTASSVATQTTPESPAASLPPPAQPNSTNSGRPMGTPAMPSATTPVRNESLRKDPARKENLEKQAPPAAKVSNAKPQKVVLAAPVEKAQPSAPARKPEPAKSIQLGMSTPIEQARTAPAPVDAQAPAIPTAAPQSLPEVGTGTPAAIAPPPVSGGREMFASPQIEEKPTHARSTAKISESSDPVFAAPDPSGAKPSSIEPAKRVVYVEPVYPAAARAAKIEGSVDVLATIGKDGVPRSLEPLNGDPQLAAAAIAAISNWRYRPAMLNGQSEESLITITVKFAL